MTAIKGDGYSQARLGALEHPAETRVIQAAPAFECLSMLGLPAPRRGLRNAIALALMHSSYYHENQATLPGITKATLDVLNRLGAAFLQKLAAAEIYRSGANLTSGAMSKDVAQIVSAFPAWTAEQKWLRESASLSIGLDRETLTSKITAFLYRQVIGVLCLEGEEEVAAGLLSDHIAAQRRIMASDSTDPKSALYEHLGRDAVTYEYQHEGPDHAIVFRAVAMDTRRRTGEGTGRSKKAAAHQAALDFVRRHIPHAFTTRDETVTRRMPAREVPGPDAHVQAVRRMQDLFALPATSRPLLSQALVHASWAYENRSEIAKCHQQDYQVLAYLGSLVLIYEHLLAAARHTVVDPPDEFAFITLPSDIYNAAFQQTGLSAGLLLGAGQRTQGIPEEIGADVFQAVIGAVSATENFQGTLAERWPSEWRSVWQRVAPTAPRPVDPTTRLERAASAMKLHVRYEFRTSGPDHAPRYTAVALLDSVALGVHFRVEGAAMAGKTPAKHQASLAVLSVLDRLADQSPARSFDGADERDRSLARFLLAHQAFVLDMSPAPVQRWVDTRLFGLHLAPDPSALLKWAVGIDELLGLDVPLQPSSHLREAFRKTVEEPADPDHTLDTALTRSMDALEQIEAPEDLTHSHIQDLVQLCDVYRCLGVNDSDISLPELADDWWTLHRGRLTTTAPPPAVQLSGRERAVLDAALSTVMAGGGDTSAEFLGVRPLHVRFRSTEPTPPATAEDICTLWSRASRTATMEATEHGIDVIVTTTDAPSEPGPITQAVTAALRPAPEPYRAAVADLLHDLKNQLIAARLADSQPAESRTAQLQQQLTASHHLDEAHALALRLHAATSLLTSAGSESVELGGFLRHYAGAVLTRLPASISLSIPQSRSAVHVALGARALTAVLDNLVGNAIQALRDGGAITLDWTADEYEAVVEITDDGPGLPPHIAAALNSGKRVRSTKPGGNGLGLLGVRSLLARAGGQLSPASTASGTAWLITLPIATPSTSEPA
ncbi:ATP-binding protein [Streptomyces pseudovenezuelae]|uniref:histidine kinase n=1 Tax=Streptomyces pseudovenezuelae TaxID=67350 RepID=A0ABT6M1L7_9ACTN|nr:ATP-binding protein [Streptomyces pseudovenezuelae]MDH6221549.1 dsRNA-specific ribonuclease [Streptomyces pseudovenezuelae]